MACTSDADCAVGEVCRGGTCIPTRTGGPVPVVDSCPVPSSTEPDPGGSFGLNVTITNLGTQTAENIMLRVSIGNTIQEVSFPATVVEGQSVTREVMVTAPGEGGQFDVSAEVVDFS